MGSKPNRSAPPPPPPIPRGFADQPFQHSRHVVAMICDRCGAPRKSSQCDYCGTSYAGGVPIVSSFSYGSTRCDEDQRVAVSYEPLAPLLPPYFKRTQERLKQYLTDDTDR